MKILDVGCGKSKTEGSVGIDKRVTDTVDVVCDLDKQFYPFLNNTFDKVYLIDVLEHLSDVIMVLEEIHRICKPGAEIYIRVPHFSSCHTYGDITHKRSFTTESFDYLTGLSKFDYYTKARFEKIRLKINFWKLHRILGISWVANRFPSLYEKYFPFIFTAMNIEIWLNVVK